MNITISRQDQITFAKEILPLIEGTKDPAVIDHLFELVNLLVSWVGDDNGVAIDLGEYVGEIRAIAKGEGDTGWKDNFKASLYEQIGRDLK